MNTITRFLPFILLNIVISAATTLLVLWFWDQSHSSKPLFETSDAEQIMDNYYVQSTTDNNQAAVNILPPIDKPVIIIENVFGVGDVDKEFVLLSSIGDNEINLAGWKLFESIDHQYTFPEIWLRKEGKVQVYTKSGTNNAIELYWGLTESVWQTGETVQLLDYQGSERAIYQIP